MEILTGKKTENGAKSIPIKSKGVEVVISAPNIQTPTLKIIGTAPLVVNKFSAKARNQIIATQQAGSKAKSKKIREAKDFQAAYEGAFHKSSAGWFGVPAGAFRTAMVDVCRATDLKMTMAKLAIFVEADGLDEDDGTPLVRIYGKPEKHTAPVRNDNGSIDIRVRPMWREWHIILRVRFDADMLSLESVCNLLSRAGLQVGICEGRPFSKNSTGCGWGTFKVEAK